MHSHRMNEIERYTSMNRDVALKIFNNAKGNWQVRSFGAPDKREEYYITSDDLGDVCNMIKSDPYSEFKAKRIVQTHNSFDGLLEACKAGLKTIVADAGEGGIIQNIMASAIAEAESLEQIS